MTSRLNKANIDVLAFFIFGGYMPIHLCFILLTGLNMKEEPAKMLVPVHYMTYVKKYGTDKNYSVGWNLGPSVIYYEIKESPEEVVSLIKKECK